MDSIERIWTATRQATEKEITDAYQRGVTAGSTSAYADYSRADTMRVAELEAQLKDRTDTMIASNVARNTAQAQVKKLEAELGMLKTAHAHACMQVLALEAKLAETQKKLDESTYIRMGAAVSYQVALQELKDKLAQSEKGL